MEGDRMLCLSRKAGEAIRIGDAVVTIEKIRGKQVKLAIKAPSEIKVIRQELIELQSSTQERDARGADHVLHIRESDRSGVV